MNKISPDKRRLILHDLLEGCSQRSCERKHDVSNNTIAKVFRDAGDMAIAKVSEIRDLESRVIQADELFSFVGAKQKNVERMRRPSPDAGTAWCYLAEDAESKFVIDYRIGSRSVYDATEFMRSVSSRLKRDEHGRFAVRPTIVTDGLPAYKEACQIAFGTDADVGMLIKKYSKVDENGELLPGSRYIGADRVPIIGSPRFDLIHTGYIERTNLNVRMDCRRFGRQTNAFSKTLMNHKRHVALWVFYTNFCRIPKCLGITPAMAAGVTDHIWEVTDMLDLTDTFIADRLKAQIGWGDEAEEETLPEGEPTHWVYRSELHYKATVHEADCFHFKRGAGHGRGNARAGQWLPFYSQEDALAAAAQFEPDRHNTCNVCIGSYRNAGGYRGPRG